MEAHAPGRSITRWFLLAPLFILGYRLRWSARRSKPWGQGNFQQRKASQDTRGWVVVVGGTLAGVRRLHAHSHIGCSQLTLLRR